MKILLLLTVLLGSIATGCQNSDFAETPQTNNPSPSQNSTSSSTPTTARTPRPSPSNNSKAKPTTRSSKQVTMSPNNPADSQRTCRISAYVIDKDPKGLNVRSGPNNSSEIIGKLPTTTIAVIVDLAGSQGDWVQLTKAESPEKIEFQGTGWVYAQLLGTSTRGYGSNGVSVYSSPSTQSSTIGRLPKTTGVKLLSCDQSWALVERDGLKGWIAPDAQCPNPLTTCP